MSVPDSIKEKAVKHAINLIRIPSLSGHEENVALYIKDELSNVGVDDVVIDELGNVVALIRNNNHETPLIFEGHMDHVEPGNIERWIYDPYVAKMVGKKLFGRGSVDMKSAIAAMIASAEHLTKFKLERNIAFIFVVHEETAEGLALKYAIEKTLRKKPYLIVLGEATSLNLSVGHRGRSLIEVSIRGKTAHASMPSLGLNSLIAASYAINWVEENKEKLPKHPILGKSTITPTIIDCSPKISPQIPDLCKIVFDRRIIPGESQTSVLGFFDKLKEDLMRKGFHMEVKVLHEKLRCWTGKIVNVKYFFKSWILNENSMIVKDAYAIIKNINREAKIITWNFSTDGVYSAGERKIPTLGFGPGNEKLAHQPNENIDIDEIKLSVEGYVKLASKFAM